MRRQPDNWRKWAMWLGWLICLELAYVRFCVYSFGKMVGWWYLGGWWWMDATLGCYSFDLEKHGSSVAKRFFFWNKMNHFTFFHRDINLTSYSGHSQVQLLLILMFNLYQLISTYIILHSIYPILDWRMNVARPTKKNNRGVWHFMTQYPVRSGIMLMTHHFKWLVKMGWFMKSGLPH